MESKYEIWRRTHQLHYSVQTEDDYYCRLLFDGETLSWRLIEVKKEGIDLLKLKFEGYEFACLRMIERSFAWYTLLNTALKTDSRF